MTSKDSDSEDDPDYIPPQAVGAGSSSSSDEEPDAKRPRTRSPQLKETSELDKQKLWAEFQASMSTPDASERPPSRVMVKIEKRFRFAGEEVTEVLEVPEDSEDAKKWPRWPPPEAENVKTSQSIPPSVPAEGTATTSAATSSATVEPIAEPPKPAAPAKPAGRRPGPRKSKINLASKPAKKLTTLDKSAMDWRAHVDTEGASGLKDELEANRRGGGYLEKVEFLQRVEDRKTDNMEASTSKRRRG